MNDLPIEIDFVNKKVSESKSYSQRFLEADANMTTHRCFIIACIGGRSFDIYSEMPTSYSSVCPRDDS